MAKRGKKGAGKRSLADIARHKDRLRKKLCSEYWTEIAVHQGRQHLPTGWVTCPACLIPMPPVYFSGLRCLDCHYGGVQIEGLPGTNWLGRA